MEVMQYSKDEVVGNGSMEPLVVQSARLNGKDVSQTVNGNGEIAAELNGSRVEEEHKSSVYLDEDGEASKTADIEIGNVGQLQKLVSAARSGAKDGGNWSGAIEEEVIELEFFERAIDKLHTHSAYCPHCRNPISKVVLRIKRETRSVDPDNKLDLVGCLECFRIFLPKTITDESSGRAEEQQESDNATSQGKCFDLLWLFGGTAKAQTSQKQPSPTMPSDQGQKPNDGHSRGDNSSSSHDSNGTQSAPTPLLQGTRAPPPEMNDNATKQQDEPHYSRSTAQSIFDLEGGLSGGALMAAASMKPEPEITEGENNKVKGGDVHISIDESPNKAGTGTSTSTQDPPLECEETVSKSPEVVKSIVYGGLMESITSLSVVSSAAASGATTLNIITIGVANLIGGLFVIAHNLLDLKTNRPEDEYQKALGQRKHFLLHAILALLSYLIFGLAPPALYGFTFRHSDDPDFKLLAVAVASFVCILLLAIGKAYTCGANTFKEYFLTILQYATAAATASCVAYAVGDLFQKLMDELGWFNSDALLLPNINSPNPNWPSY